MSDGDFDFGDLTVEQPGDSGDDARSPSSWAPLDLTDAVNGVDVPAPELLERTDGVPLLYRGRTHWFQGESEALKSWLAQFGAAQALLAGGSVIWIDFEDDERGVTSRMRSLSVPADRLVDQGVFRYIRPDEPLYKRDGTALPGVVDLMESLDRAWDFVVIDGVTEAMTNDGLSYIDNADIASWMRRFPKMIAALTGAAVACIDHVTKNRETQGRYAIGGQHKLAGVTGATYKVTAVQPLSRSLHDPVTGTSKITVEKDRPGWVRARADHGGVVGMLEVTAYPDGGVTVRLIPPGDATTAPPAELCARILEHLVIYDGSSKTNIEESVTGKAPTIREALKWMVGKGWIRVEQVGQAHRHYLSEEGRKALNEGGQV